MNASNSDHLSRIFVAGHNGMVGSAITRQLALQANVEVITRSRQELDLTDQAQVRQFMSDEHIDRVYMCAARVGGIYANNTFPGEFIYDNLVIQTNLIHQAYLSKVERLLFLGSSCIYPKHAEQPMGESALLTGKLEPTNEPYAIAKIAGIKLCESYNRQYGTDFRSVMPTNLYGTNDNFHPENSHVIPALIRRFHEAKINQSPVVTIWGTGLARREFLHVDDMARASVYVMDLDKDALFQAIEPTQSHINVGSGTDVSIKELAQAIATVVDYQGEIDFDTNRPDGTPKKCLNIDILERLGWRQQISLMEGLADTYTWYCTHQDRLRAT